MYGMCEPLEILFKIFKKVLIKCNGYFECLVISQANFCFAEMMIEYLNLI